MPTIDWPEALVPQTAQLTLRKSTVQFASPFNGTPQAFDFIAERWVLSCSLAQMSARNPRGVGAFCNRLAGGVERVRVWPFETKGTPRGTLRGLPTLGLAAARGDQILTLANATGSNLLLGGSFEFDTNADGVGDGWNPIQSGGVSGLVYGRSFSNPMDGVFEQGIDVTFTATGGTYVGIERTVQLLQGAGPYTVRMQVRGGGEAQRHLVIVEPRDAGGAIIGGSLTVLDQALPGSPTAVGATFTAPAGTVQCTLRLQMVALNTGTEAAVRWDGVAVKPGVADFSWPGNATLLADDYIAAGGQLFMAAASATANDAGRLVVPLVNRVRGTIASGSPVTWYRPSCEMVMPAMQAGPVHRPGAVDSTALDLVEVW